MTWYFRHKEQISGPYPKHEIERYLVLGRVEAEDEVSQDRSNWVKLRDAPDFQEAVRLLGRRDAYGRKRFEDERDAAADFEGGERRKSEPADILAARASHASIFAPPTMEKNWKGYVLLAFFLLVLTAVVFIYKPDNPIQISHMPQCHTKAAANVNWLGCDKGGAWLNGANLSHANLAHAIFNSVQIEKADLSSANLEGADLSYASLKGANLSGANLSSTILVDANLEGANLSGAILTGAKLDRAIWIDGRQCKSPSEGVCN